MNQMQTATENLWHDIVVPKLKTYQPMERRSCTFLFFLSYKGVRHNILPELSWANHKWCISFLYFLKTVASWKPHSKEELCAEIIINWIKENKTIYFIESGEKTYPEWKWLNTENRFSLDYYDSKWLSRHSPCLTAVADLQCIEYFYAGICLHGKSNLCRDTF